MASKQRVFTIGLGMIKVENAPGATLKVLGLGSGLAVVIASPRYGAAGIAHIVLPDSRIDPARARERPAYFADTGVPALLKAFRRIGVHQPGDLTIWLAGGSRIMNATGNFDIGKRNLLACRKALWHNELVAYSEDTGACVTRSVWIQVDADRPVVEIPGRGRRRL